MRIVRGTPFLPLRLCDIYLFLLSFERFNLSQEAKIEGNIFYASEEVKASAVIEGDITGTQEVQS